MKKKFYISLTILLIGFLVGTSWITTFNTKALANTKHIPYSIEYVDRINWKWNVTEIVSEESANHSRLPSIAVDTSGNVHIAWYDETDYGGSGTDYDVFYKYWDDTNSSWTTTEVVSTESTGNSYSPSLNVDSSGNTYIVWYDTTDYLGAGTDIDVFYKHRDATTAIWTTSEVISTESTGKSYHPFVAVDQIGDVHIAWDDETDYGGSGTDYDIFYKRWNSSTSSWTITEVVSTESWLDSSAPSFVIDSTGNVHITWEDTTPYMGAFGTYWDIFYKYWDSSSSSWTVTELVTDSSGDGNEPSIGIDDSGNIHVVWDENEIFYRSWDSSSRSWSVIEVVSTERTGISINPFLAIDSTGTVHVTWSDTSDYSESGTDSDIFYKRRDSSSSSWTKTEVVSRESTGVSEFPSIATDIVGNVYIVWDDTTDIGDIGTDDDIFYKLLAGLTAAPELAFITPSPTDLSNVYLDWNDVISATEYFVYRSNSYIWSVESLLPITTVSSSEYVDFLSSEGYYYYAVVAENFVGNSSCSNCQYVEYKIPHVREFTIISSLLLTTFVSMLIVMRTRKKKK